MWGKVCCRLGAWFRQKFYVRSLHGFTAFTLSARGVNSPRWGKSRINGARLSRGCFEKVVARSRAKAARCANDITASTKLLGLYSHWNYHNLISRSGRVGVRLFTRLRNKRRNKHRNIVIRGYRTFSYLMKSWGRLSWCFNGNESCPLLVYVRTQDNFSGDLLFCRVGF